MEAIKIMLKNKMWKDAQNPIDENRPTALEGEMHHLVFYLRIPSIILHVIYPI